MNNTNSKTINTFNCQSCCCKFETIVKRFECLNKHSICEFCINSIYHNTKMNPLIKIRTEHCESCLKYNYIKKKFITK